jgi:hypothetical protein
MTKVCDLAAGMVSDGWLDLAYRVLYRRWADRDVVWTQHPELFVPTENYPNGVETVMLLGYDILYRSWTDRPPSLPMNSSHKC